MSGLKENGYDFFNASATQTQIMQIMGEMGYFYPNGPFPNFASPALVVGRYGYGLRLEIHGANPNQLNFAAIRAIDQHVTSGFTAYGLRIEDDSQPGSAPFMCIYDLVNNLALCTVSFEPNGVVKVWSGGFIGGVSTTLLGASEADQWRLGVDFDAQVNWKTISTTSGEIEVRIHTIGGGGAAGSTPAIHLVNVNNQPGANAYFDGYGWGWHFGNFGVAPHFKIDDERCWSSAGAINNSWLGTQRVQTLLPGGDGPHQDFTRSNTGLAHYLNASNNLVDDSLYEFDSTAGHYELFTPQPLVNSPNIDWISANSFVRQDDATQRFVKNRIVSGGVTADGASFATPQTYSLDQDVFETDPNTGVQFTGAAVNALDYGLLDFA